MAKIYATALNSLSGDALQATFECIAPFGRFIELGKRDISQNSRLEMAHFNQKASVDLGIVREKRPKLTKRLMRNAFQIVFILPAGCRQGDLSILCWFQGAVLLLNWLRRPSRSSRRMMLRSKFAALISLIRRAWNRPSCAPLKNWTTHHRFPCMA